MPFSRTAEHSVLSATEPAVLAQLRARAAEYRSRAMTCPDAALEFGFEVYRAVEAGIPPEQVRRACGLRPGHFELALARGGYLAAKVGA